MLPLKRYKREKAIHYVGEKVGESGETDNDKNTVGEETSGRRTLYGGHKIV